MDQLISTTTEHLTILLQYPTESFFDRKWVVALIGALGGVLVAFLINLVREHIKERKLRKIVVKSIYTEVSTNRSLNNKDLSIFKEKINEFRVMAESKKFDSHPSMQYTGKLSMDYYNIYLKDLGLLGNFTRGKIFIFYEYLKSIALTAKGLENRFMKFYDKQDVTIDWRDVVSLAEKHIKQMEALDAVGAEVMAVLVVKHKVDREIKDSAVKKRKKLLLKYLRKLKRGEIVDAKKLEEEYKLNLVLVIVNILRSKMFKNKSYGKYIKK